MVLLLLRSRAPNVVWKYCEEACQQLLIKSIILSPHHRQKVQFAFNDRTDVGRGLERGSIGGVQPRAKFGIRGCDPELLTSVQHATDVLDELALHIRALVDCQTCHLLPITVASEPDLIGVDSETVRMDDLLELLPKDHG
jgi:hypothetical protein